MYDEGNPFPHDGENGINCTGYGCCDCDEKNYGYHGGGSSGGGSSGGGSDGGAGCLIMIFFVIALVIGTAISEILGVILLLIIFFVAISR